MQHSTERILTTHAGSLPRPDRLTELFALRATGVAVDEAEIGRLSAEATVDIVKAQAAAGIGVANNGEQGREGFFLYVQRRMSGFSGQGSRAPQKDIADYPAFKKLREQSMGARKAVSNFHPPKVTGAITYLDEGHRELAQELDQFEAALQAHGEPFAETFVTAPSPGIIAAALPNEHYDSFDAYVDALTAALKIEYEAIVGRGHLLQIDAPDLALERHVSFADKPVSEFVGFVERIVAAINGAIAALPREKVRLHVCWGNYEGPHDSDVAFADIREAILGARVGGFMLPFANSRHAHEVDLFKGGRLKDDQVLIAGVIDTTTNFIEHPQVVAERIERAARAVGDPTRVMAGTDCGFDTSAGMGRVAVDVVWAKLKSMREGADIASERLLG